MTGRWPANVILSPGAAEALDRQAPNTGSDGRPAIKASETGGVTGWTRGTGAIPRDKGGASRFFLNAGYEPWELEWILANGLRPCGTPPATPTNS